LLQAFGFNDAFLQEGGEPLSLSPEVKARLGLEEDASLSIGILNPKYVLNQILEQTLKKDQADRLRRTILYSEMSQMIYGLQEYTAYEWVTRMIQNNEYDLIVLDTPPAVHAKDFFGAPDRIKNLMESRVFQLFLPKKNWFGGMISFNWLEKLLGSSVFGDSKIFFETFIQLRARILERCQLLSQFFKNDQVAVVAVSTTESSAQLELKGLIDFLNAKRIPVETLIINQVETKVPAQAQDSAKNLENEDLPAALRVKLKQLILHQESRAEASTERLNDIKSRFGKTELISVPMNYASDGFEILKQNAVALLN
jgi:anion-transporting  ArsA/GET3 family ATPase